MTNEQMNAIDETFRKRFRGLIEETHIRQTDLSTALDVSRLAIYGWMTGWHKYGLPSGYNLARIAQHFDVTVDYLLGLSDERKA